MTKRALKMSAVLGACVLALAAAPAGISFAETTTPETGVLAAHIDVPANLVPPAGNVLSAVFQAHGVQIYGCTTGKWTLIEPAASLTGVTIKPVRPVTALHFRGPSWESDQDGSLVDGKSPVSAPSPNPNSIPQLLVTANTTRGDGIFGKVTFIQRLATSGGLAPTTTCTTGQTTATPYRAIYRFFTPA